MSCKGSEEHSEGQGVNQRFARSGTTHSMFWEGPWGYGQKSNGWGDAEMEKVQKESPF